jgi:hypothetical protein
MARRSKKSKSNQRAGEIWGVEEKRRQNQLLVCWSAGGGHFVICRSAAKRSSMRRNLAAFSPAFASRRTLSTLALPAGSWHFRGKPPRKGRRWR